MRGKGLKNGIAGFCSVAAAFLLSASAQVAFPAQTRGNGVTAHRGASVR